jgi:hypothetical protein
MEFQTNNSNTKLNINKNKKSISNEDLLTNLYEKTHGQKDITIKSLKKIDDNNFVIPKYSEHSIFKITNYNLQQLKCIAKKYNLKVSGNKEQLTNRILHFLYFSNYIIHIQRIIRGFLQRKLNMYRGPAFLKRNICVNNYDFLSMEELTNVPYTQFFSYIDKDDGLIYGFDILSLHNLISKTNGPVKNPFNTKLINSNVIKQFRSLIRMSKLYKIPIITDLNIDTQTNSLVTTPVLTVEQRAIELFHNIDLLGNYTQSTWFTDLNSHQIVKFIRELLDIWNYRANLSEYTKQNICHPSGNPFYQVPSFIFNGLQTFTLREYQGYALGIMEKMVNSGIDRDSKALGAFYVLGALTLVNNSVATALPWLYQSVLYS